MLNMTYAIFLEFRLEIFKIAIVLLNCYVVTAIKVLNITKML